MGYNAHLRLRRGALRAAASREPQVGLSGLPSPVLLTSTDFYFESPVLLCDTFVFPMRKSGAIGRATRGSRSQSSTRGVLHVLPQSAKATSLNEFHDCPHER